MEQSDLSLSSLPLFASAIALSCSSITRPSPQPMSSDDIGLWWRTRSLYGRSSGSRCDVSSSDALENMPLHGLNRPANVHATCATKNSSCENVALSCLLAFLHGLVGRGFAIGPQHTRPRRLAFPEAPTG